MIKLLWILLLIEVFANALLVESIVASRKWSENKFEDKLLNSKSASIQKNKIMKNLYNINNVDGLAQLGVLMPPKPPQSLRAFARAGNAPEAIQQETVDATPGKCDPKPVCISNPLTLDITSTQFAFPPCINIHRCDGCCPTNEKCVPIKSHQVKLHKVGIINFEGENQPIYNETTVSVSNHTECQCECQWESDEDCHNVNPNFVRNPQACECICPEVVPCDAFHYFDRDECACKCRKDIFGLLRKNCQAKSFNWNETICKCETNKSSSNQKDKIARG